MAIYKRKLFNRTPFKHYGSGIASGLAETRPGFAAGGRVNFDEGGTSILDASASKSTGREDLSVFSNTVVDTISNGLENYLVTEYMQNYDAVNKLDKIGKNDYLKNLTEKWYSSLPEDIRGAVSDEAKQQILERYTSTFNKVNSGEYAKNKDLYLNSIQKNGSAMPNYGTELEAFNTTYAGKISGLLEEAGVSPEPKDTEISSDDSDDSDDGSSDGSGIKGQLDMQSDKGRQEMVDYYKKLQEETELNEKARRQAVQAGFINFGASDPVQEGESTMQAIFKSFQDPMANLREREYKQAEDIYTNVRDSYSDDISRSDTQKLIDQYGLQGAKELMGGTSGSGGMSGTDYVNYASMVDLFDAKQIMAALGIDKETYDKNPLLYKDMLTRQLSQGALTQPTAATNLTDQTITKKATGGRVGLQEGGDPMIQQAAMEQAAMTNPDAMQGVEEAPTTPEEVFAQLRQALPDYISDDVVLLLAQDQEALSEFVEIQTSAQVEEFEDKYRVQLDLPQEEQTAFPESEMI